MSASLAIVLEKLLFAKSKDGSRPVLIAILAVFIALTMVTSALLYVLTSPIEFLGALGEFQLHYAGILGGGTGPVGENTYTDAEITALVADIADPQRQAVLQTALSLVGKVPYFWGGKSAPGWNPEWGTMKLVTAPGVSSSGKLRPYGLDCSGYTDWVFRTAGIGNVLGGGVHYQWRESTPITEAELVPGDLVFKNIPDPAIINHVGIYFGKDEKGGNLYLHCSASGGGVVLNGYSGFAYFRRPPALALPEEEGTT